MAARKLAAATASTVFSIATSFVLSSPARTRDASSLHQLHFEKHDIEEHFIFSLSQDGDQFLGSAEKILEEAGEEIAHSVRRFKKSSLLDNAKVGALISARFVDVLTRAAVVLLDYKLHGLLDSSDQELSEVHKRAASSLYEACACHGGLLVKFGQYLSNNAGTVVPKEYVEALTPLQDRCTPLPIELIRECVEEELSKLLVDGAHGDGNLIDQVFQDFDPVPLGAASLAQVHSATLKDGRRVAIKVQRKNLSTTTKADMLALQILARAVDRAFPGSGFEWLLYVFLGACPSLVWDYSHASFLPLGPNFIKPSPLNWILRRKQRMPCAAAKCYAGSIYLPVYTCSASSGGGMVGLQLRSSQLQFQSSPLTKC